VIDASYGVATLMDFSFKSVFKKSYQRWIAKNIPPRDSITLNRKNIFILPSKNGLFFIGCSIVIFIAAINYAASMAFGLAFLMISIFILSILYCFNNLNQLTLKSQPALPVFCGDDINFKVLLSRNPKRKHESLQLNFPESLISDVDLVLEDKVGANVFTPALKRGEYRAPRLRITTLYPLGLCRAWSVIDLNLKCLVYPKPIPFVLDHFDSGGSTADESAISRNGSEEFYGLRDYVPGDSMRQIAWKNVARGQGMQVKQFVDYVDNRTWLDWDMFYGFGLEDRLSRLCYCVLKLSQTNDAYGLKMPGVEVAPNTGPEHKRKLLKILALFNHKVDSEQSAGSD
jgi:uncharacterized protein (DUF58 family)